MLSPITYQPLEEIRDYFGDDIGLYYAFMDMWNRAIFLLSFYGIFVFGNQLLYFDGPDDNDFETQAKGEVADCATITYTCSSHPEASYGHNGWLVQCSMACPWALDF